MRHNASSKFAQTTTKTEAGSAKAIDLNSHTTNTLPPKQGLYDPANEHDSCGVGFVAHIKGEKSHSIVEQGLTILKRVTHRGAVGADSQAGDGAGLLLQIPDEFFQGDATDFDIPAAGKYGVVCFSCQKTVASELN